MQCDGKPTWPCTRVCSKALIRYACCSAWGWDGESRSQCAESTWHGSDILYLDMIGKAYDVGSVDTFVITSEETPDVNPF